MAHSGGRSLPNKKLVQMTVQMTVQYIENRMAVKEHCYVVFGEYLKSNLIVHNMIELLPENERNALLQSDQKTSDALALESIIDNMCFSKIRDFLLDTLYFHRSLLAHKKAKYFMKCPDAMEYLGDAFIEYLFSNNEQVVDVSLMRQRGKEFLYQWIMSGQLQITPPALLPNLVTTKGGDKPDNLSEGEERVLTILEKVIGECAVQVIASKYNATHQEQVKYYLYSQMLEWLKSSGHFYYSGNVDNNTIEKALRLQASTYCRQASVAIRQHVERVLYQQLQTSRDSLSQETKHKLEAAFSGFKSTIEQDLRVCFFEADYRYCTRFILVLLIENQRFMDKISDSTDFFVEIGKKIAAKVIGNIVEAADESRNLCLDASIVKCINQKMVDDIIDDSAVQLVRDRMNVELNRYTKDVEELYQGAKFPNPSSQGDPLGTQVRLLSNYATQHPFRSRFFKHSLSITGAKALAARNIVEKTRSVDHQTADDPLSATKTALSANKLTLVQWRRFRVFSIFGGNVAKGGEVSENLEQFVDSMLERRKKESENDRYRLATPLRSGRKLL